MNDVSVVFLDPLVNGLGNLYDSLRCKSVCIMVDSVEIEGEGGGVGEGGVLAELDAEAYGAQIEADGLVEFGSRNEARYGTNGPVGDAAKKFFDTSTGKSIGFKRIPLGNGTIRFQFFSPAETEGYGKLYTLDLSRDGVRVDRLRQTIDPGGNIISEKHN